MEFNFLKATATSRRQFTFYHSNPRSSWYSFYWPWISGGWKVESTLEPPSGFEHRTPGLALTTGPLIHKVKTSFISIKSFFLYCIDKWNKLNPEVRTAEPLYKSKKSIKIEKIEISLYGVHNPLGVKLLSHLKLQFSHLNKQKFRHGFNDMLKQFTPIFSPEQLFMKCSPENYWIEKLQNDLLLLRRFNKKNYPWRLVHYFRFQLFLHKWNLYSSD